MLSVLPKLPVFFKLPSISFNSSQKKVNHSYRSWLQCRPCAYIEAHWSRHLVVKDSFWDKALKTPAEVGSLFKYRSLDSSVSGVHVNKQTFWTLFHDNYDGEGATIHPRSVLRMYIEREEVPYCVIKFEYKADKHQAFDMWVKHILA